MSYQDFNEICKTCSMPIPEKKEDKLRMKCTQCNWMNDESEAVYGHRHCGKFCTCFCHVVAPHFNGTSAATHLREVIIEQAASQPSKVVSLQDAKFPKAIVDGHGDAITT